MKKWTQMNMKEFDKGKTCKQQTSYDLYVYFY